MGSLITNLTGMLLCHLLMGWASSRMIYLRRFVAPAMKATGIHTENFLSKVDEAINDLNIYDILEPCYHSPEVSEISSANIRLPSSFRDIGEPDKILPVRKRMFGRAWPLRAPVREGFVPTWPQLLSTSSVPCTDDEVATAWLNKEAVRKALHAKYTLGTGSATLNNTLRIMSTRYWWGTSLTWMKAKGLCLLPRVKHLLMSMVSSSLRL